MVDKKDKKKTTKGKPSKKDNNVVKQKISGSVRLVFYGGSKKSEDNWSFYDGAQVVIKDYEKKFPVDEVVSVFVDSAKIIVDVINSQKRGKVISLDIFSHGSPRGLYFYKTASTNNNFTREDIENENLNAGLYAGYLAMWGGDDEHEDIRNVSNIDFSRFKNEGAVIEIHGCKAGLDPDSLTDSISKNLSEELPNGYVIAHVSSAFPDGNRDYRHGERVVWKNGAVIKSIRKSGFLRMEDII